MYYFLFILSNNTLFLSYCYITSLRTYYVSLPLVIISGECNRVDPLRLDLAKWKTILKQFDSFSVFVQM